MVEQPDTRRLERTSTPAQMFQAGVGLHRQRRLDEAEDVYRSLLRRAPEHVGALRNLGLLKIHRGQFGEAVQILERLLSLNPNSPGARNDLGVAFAALGRHQAALEQFKRATELLPSFAEAHKNLGDSLSQLSRHAEAIAAFETAIALSPKFAAAHNDLGNALARSGRHAEAVAHYDQAAKFDPGFADAHFNAGVALTAIGRAQEAISRFETALSLRPNHADSHAGIGKALTSLGRLPEALRQFEKALALQPESPEAHNRVGNALVALNRHVEAIEHYRRAIAIRPDLAEPKSNLGNALMALDRNEEAVVQFREILSHPAPQNLTIGAYNRAGVALLALRRPDEALGYLDKALAIERASHPAGDRGAVAPESAAAQVCSNLATALVELDRADEALPLYHEALAIDPNLSSAHHGLGHAYVTLGQLDKARAAFERAVALSPDVPRFHRSLLELKRVSSDDPELAQLERLSHAPEGLSEDELIELEFSLSKAYADLQQHELSFRHLLQGNALKRRQTAYNEAVEIGKLERSRVAFTPQVMERLHGCGEPSQLPIFILGMPRSGTTLVEQILAAHSKVFGAGELENFGRVAATICEPPGATVPYPEVMASLSCEQMRAIGRSYLESFPPQDSQVVRVTDKLPANFRLAGLIHLALPQARIIHVRRDPVDTCLSCFSKIFRGFQGFTYDLAELGRYYRAYEDLMAHWRQILPAGVMLEVQYEELVADFEPQARRIVGHCGLDWEVQCLSFHTTERSVRTASATQVRQPLYQSAVGRWRPYERWLGPLVDALARP